MLNTVNSPSLEYQGEREILRLIEVCKLSDKGSSVLGI